MLYITTSWDDGDVLDIKIAQLLEKYNLKGTFYITRDYRKDRLSNEQIKEISAQQEIGAHTLTHPNLCKISTEQKQYEIEGSKKWLEELLSREILMFCYPAGHFDAEAEKVVNEVGFKGARTTRLGEIALSTDPFQMPTTLAIYPMPLRKIGPHSYYWGKLLQPLQERGPALRKLGVPLFAFRSWEALACSTFDIALKRGGVFHLWGHSWEIERYGMWEPLEHVLRYMGNRKDCQYVTNDKLLNL